MPIHCLKKFVRMEQYWYYTSSSSWKQKGKKGIDGEAASDESGYSVSMPSDGTVLAIGAHLNHSYENGSQFSFLALCLKSESIKLLRVWIRIQ